MNRCATIWTLCIDIFSCDILFGMNAKEAARCKELQASLAEVKKQYETFTRALDDAARTGSYDKAQELAGTLNRELSALEGRVCSPWISTEFRYFDNPEKKIASYVENIDVNIEHAIRSHTAFYKEHDIELPSDFAETMRDIWRRNYVEMKKAIEEYGFNYLLLIPEKLSPLSELDEKMTKGYELNGVRTQTHFWVDKNSITKNFSVMSKAHILLLHNTLELDDHPILKDTLNIKSQNIAPQNDLTLEEYEILQRQLLSKQGENIIHIDTKRVTWCPGSEVPPSSKGGFPRVVNACWRPVEGQLGVSAGDPDYSYDSLGCRLSRSFS